MTTNCAFPPELDDKQLLIYLDGKADEATRSHLKGCAYCRGRAQALDRLQTHLTGQLYRLTCPSSIELGEYHLRMLPASQMLVIAQHVRECPHCQREVAELENFLADPVAENQLLGAAKVLIARLMGGQIAPGKQRENGFTSAIPTLRGEIRGPLTFEADGMVITLDIQQTNEGTINILGQVAADDQDQWTASKVELQQADSPPLTAALDDLGAFRFEELRLGSTQITITSPSGIIVQIPNFDIAF